MKLATIRKIHNWATLFVMIPLTIITITGIVLMFKPNHAWIQPPTAKGSGKTPTLFFATMLDTIKAVPGANVSSWEDIDRIDVRPNKGVAKVQLKSNLEIQVDLATGTVLQSAFRRSDIIEKIHTGEQFGEWVKYWIFVPASLIFFVQLITGIILFFRIYILKMKKKRIVAEEVLSVE